MEIENNSYTNDIKKNIFNSFNEYSNNKEINYNNKLLLSDGIFKSIEKGKYNFFINKDIYSEKKNSFIYPNCKIISSLFTKDNINRAFNQTNKNKNNNKIPLNIIDDIKNNEISNDINIKENNTSNRFLINYKIYNIKESSIFHIKLYNNYIKYFPIFTNLTELEKIICFNPLVENNPNFEIISPNMKHDIFYINNYYISSEKLEILKDKYVRHLYTKRNIISTEEIFKYIFEEIKINISCINVQSPYDDVLKNCSNLINNINEIIDDILNIKKIKENNILNNKSQQTKKTNENKIINGTTKIENINNFEIKNKKEDNYCMFTSSKIKKSFVLSDINSKSIGNSFLEYKKNNNNNSEEKKNQQNYYNKEKDEQNKNKMCDLSERKDDTKEKNNSKNDEKNKKEIFICPYYSRIFSSHCGLGGHMSKRHPKNQNK